MSIIQKFKNKKLINSLKKKVAEGDNEAKYQLAMILIDGDIIKKDLILAKSYLEQASNEGHMQSKIFLKTKKALNTIGDIANILGDISKNINFKG